MAIGSIMLGNFKGIADMQTLDIKPITIFVGPNSSGKSSCIHALAALAQTVKVTNDVRPLVLDDEFATVHLGRFIEIIHSHTYKDAIELGIGVTGARMPEFRETEGKQGSERVEDVQALYKFRCTRRTQEMYLDSAEYKTQSFSITANRNRFGKHVITSTGLGVSPKLILPLDSAFFFQFALPNPSSPDFKAYFPTVATLFSLQHVIKQELSNALYLGPFRQSPLRRYPTRGAGPSEVGALGESSITLLANEAVQSKSRTHIKQVSQWLQHLELAKAVDVARLSTSDLFDVSMTLSDGKKFPLADLGYGLSQVLPVLVQCSFAPAGATLLFEQPEIHLHGKPAAKLADVFAETVKSRKARILIETHSPELVKAFVQLLKKGKLSEQQVAAYQVLRKGGHSTFTKFDFDEEFDVYEVMWWKDLLP